MFVSFIGYNRAYNEKGKLLFETYKAQLDYISINSLEELSPTKIMDKLVFKSKENNIKFCTFIIYPDGSIKTSDNSTLEKYFLEYLKEISPSNNYRIFDEYLHTEGAASIIKYQNQEFIIGVKYIVKLDNLISHYLILFLSLIAMNIVIVVYFSKTLTDEINIIASKLEELSSSTDIDFDNKIPITSNDEISDLIFALNNVLDKEKNNVEILKSNHQILVENEKLASLGSFIGGIAHNLRTPIMSIAGATEGINQLINEYQRSISDSRVTQEDHMEISKEMLEWTSSIKNYCSYITEIINAIKGQTVTKSSDVYSSFTIEELLNRVEILMKFELRNNNCNISIENKAPLHTVISGELSNLVQVVNNLIQNAIHSYEESGGTIHLAIVEIDNVITISIKDEGKGIPSNIKEKLFKEMTTSKGKNGTGLGLYISHSTIVGKFKGKMWFESEETKGTTFFIELQKIKNLTQKDS
jgi:signal transduction histidine kinase